MKSRAGFPPEDRGPGAGRASTGDGPAERGAGKKKPVPVPFICSVEDLEKTRKFLDEKGSSDLFVCIGTNFENPQDVLEKIKIHDSRLVISGPAHENILTGEGYDVIPLRSGGINLLDAIFEARRLSRKLDSRGVVFVWRGRPQENLEKFQEELNMRIISTCCYSKSDAEIQVKEFIANGCRVFIGHRQVCDIVDRMGARGICYYNEEAWFAAVEDAIRQTRRILRVRAALESALPEGGARGKCRYTFADIVGKSRAIREAASLARVYAETASPILITGDTGTGKELFAQSIHNAGARAGEPFLGINCASFSESLLESELFGYAPGAFTGAARAGKTGLFELARGGTLFLDEIGEAAPAMQVRLLRVLQERQVRRVGGRFDIPVNVRIIAATNQDLEELAARGAFRKDLYYRLNVLRLPMPPLRERREDIPLLVRAIAAKYGLGSSADSIAGEIGESFAGYDWPGNVRELENMVQRIAVVRKCAGGDVPEGWSARLVRPEAGGHSPGAAITAPPNAPSGTGTAPETSRPVPARADYRNFMQGEEQRYLREIIGLFGGNKTRAARYLGMSRTTLWSKLGKTVPGQDAPR